MEGAPPVGVGLRSLRAHRERAEGAVTRTRVGQSATETWGAPVWGSPGALRRWRAPQGPGSAGGQVTRNACCVVRPPVRQPCERPVASSGTRACAPLATTTPFGATLAGQRLAVGTRLAVRPGLARLLAPAPRPGWAGCGSRHTPGPGSHPARVASPPRFFWAGSQLSAPCRSPRGSRA